jgi:hypothetical protein
MKYVIQFVAGTQAIVTRVLSQVIQDARLTHVDDSAVVFESSRRIEHAKHIPFANNIFVVLATTPRKGIEASIGRLASKIEQVDFPRAQGRDRGFRIMAHIDGQLAAIDRQVRRELEREIEVFTQTTVQARGSGREYWIVGRKSLDELMFCLRLPRSRTRQTGKGELAFELCLMLVAVSMPKAGDTFLDPFAGHGGLVLARLESPARSVLYSDIAFRTLIKTLPPALTSNRRVRLMAEDALTLPSIGDGEIDVIVTDPPWGEFARLEMSNQTFVDRLAKSFDRVLHPKSGRFVILSSRRQFKTMTSSLSTHGLSIHETHGILVNGHPASVIVGGR